MSSFTSESSLEKREACANDRSGFGDEVVVGMADDADGLLVRRDKGATWTRQGSSVDIWLGPFFGRSEDEMVVVGKNGAFKTGNAGDTWTKIADLRPNGPGFSFKPNWFGCYAWDPVNNILYASSMGNPVYKLEL